MSRPALTAALAARGIVDPREVAATGDGIRASFAHAILGLFPISAVLFVLSFLVTLTVPGLRLRGRESPGELVATEAGAPAE
jgi:hypothetical protein